MSRLNSYRELEHFRERLREQRQNITTTVMVCGGTGCRASHSQDVIDAVRDELSRQRLDHSVRLCVTGCHGFCEQGPIIIIEPSNLFYWRIPVGNGMRHKRASSFEGKGRYRLPFGDRGA